MPSCNQVRVTGPNIVRHCRNVANHKGKCRFEGASRDLDKLRDAQRAVDRLPDGPDKDALTFAVLQWMQAAFTSEKSLTDKEMEWAKEVVERHNARQGG